jgi:MFS family permease
MLLVMPVILIFYNANNLSVRHLFYIQAAYSLTIVLLEIPTGYLADVWGRKNTLIIGAFFGFAGYMTYSLTSGFTYFLLAEIMLGIGQSFISGTDTALLYDTMIALKKEEKYLKIEGRMTSVGNFAEAISGIAGGLLAILSPRLPFICQACFALVAIPAALTLVEPKIGNSQKKPGIADLINAFRNALIKNKALQKNLLVSSVIGASTLTMAWFVQPYFKTIDLPTALYGISWSLLNASVGIAALSAFRFERWFGENKMIVGIIFLTTLGYVSLFAFQAYWALSFVLMFYLVRGIATPLLKDSINKLISSETRASVLSMRNLIIRGLFSSVAPIVGWMSDKINLQAALLMAGSTYFLLCLPFVYFIVVRKR